MSLTYPDRLRTAILARRKKPSQQFGQTGDVSTFGGATGCTHTILQWLIWEQKGRWYSHDDISRVAGYPWPANNRRMRGFMPSEVQRVVNTFGLPYKIVFGWDALRVARASKLGTVGFGHMYGYWPEWKGKTYQGVKADGTPNGYATPDRRAGRTQLRGFERGAHFGALFGYATDPNGPDLYYAWEPNHGSPARPEKPPYDRMTYGQFEKVYDSYRTQLKRTAYALVPKGAK